MSTQPQTIDELKVELRDAIWCQRGDDFTQNEAAKQREADAWVSLSAMVQSVLGDEATADQLKRFEEIFNGIH